MSVLSELIDSKITELGVDYVSFRQTEIGLGYSVVEYYFLGSTGKIEKEAVKYFIKPDGMAVEGI